MRRDSGHLVLGIIYVFHGYSYHGSESEEVCHDEVKQSALLVVTFGVAEHGCYRVVGIESTSISIRSYSFKSTRSVSCAIVDIALPAYIRNGILCGIVIYQTLFYTTTERSKRLAGHLGGVRVYRVEISCC